ncbi:hypothetical protein CLV51_101800 [Chitinophaga niastensis]|uniref:Uncharacterized protein n=2 Tax=Chitinophaga niastensis TaxID=536980 RepID=A0A2P8HTC5_CHINA|nr:hypothetical protein CLV51_101800 [Chitinophaga niastensis]
MLLTTGASLMHTAERLEAFFNDVLLAQLTQKDKHTLYPLNSWFLKGLNYSKSGSMVLAKYYFEQGERYEQTLPKGTLLWRAVQNEYLPKKAYYLYKTGERDFAEKMLHDVMLNMQTMEQQGFEYLVFSRIQQYHNLVRMYFAYGQTDEAIRLSAEVVAFLLKGHSEKLIDLNVPLVQHPEKYELFKYLFICQILFETLNVMIAFLKEPQLTIKVNELLQVILPAAEQYQPFSDDADLTKQTILLFESFYAGNYKLFCEKADLFAVNNPVQYIQAKHCLELYTELCRKTYM